MKTNEQTNGFLHLTIYLQNNRDIYLFIENLVKQLAKRKKANKPILYDTLLNSRSISNIINMASKMSKELDNVTPTLQDKRDAKKYICDYILNDFLPYV